MYKPTCFKQKLGNEACYSNCPVKEECYKLEDNMSEHFARVLIQNLSRRIKNAEIRHDFQVAQSLKEFRDSIRETQQELGHKV